jgi:hypothetical protein
MLPEADIAIAERIVRLETKLDFLIAQLNNLPPSPACVANHRDHDVRITALEAWRNKAIGVMLAANIIFVLVIDKIKNWMWPT